MRKITPIPYPQPIPFPRMHRCAHPYRHSLGVLALMGGWLWYSVHVKGTVGLKLAALLDPHRVGYGLPIAVLTEFVWFGLIPLVALALYLLGMWRCTGQAPSPAVRQVIAEALHEPYAPRPVRVDRVILSPEEAAQRGLHGQVVVERAYYQ